MSSMTLFAIHAHIWCACIFGFVLTAGDSFSKTSRREERLNVLWARCSVTTGVSAVVWLLLPWLTDMPIRADGLHELVEVAPLPAVVWLVLPVVVATAPTTAAWLRARQASRSASLLADACNTPGSGSSRPKLYVVQ